MATLAELQTAYDQAGIALRAAQTLLEDARSRAKQALEEGVPLDERQDALDALRVLEAELVPEKVITTGRAMRTPAS